MPGTKLFRNNTGGELKVTLTIRKGSAPDEDAGTLDFDLPAPTGDKPTQKEVTYGTKTDIYLNAINTLFIKDGSASGTRNTVVERGSPLDDQLNTHSIIDFIYDGNQVLISATNPDPKTYAFMKS